MDNHTAQMGNPTAKMQAQKKAEAGKLAKFLSRAQKKKKQQERQGLASQVFWQAFYYVLAFYITFISPTVLRFLQTIEQDVPQFVVVAMVILLPLQGKRIISACVVQFFVLSLTRLDG